MLMTAYHEAFYANCDKNKSAAPVTIPIVQKYVNAASVIDVGCHIGVWLAIFEELGVQDLVGMDGDGGWLARSSKSPPLNSCRPTSRIPFASRGVSIWRLSESGGLPSSSLRSHERQYSLGRLITVVDAPPAVSDCRQKLLVKGSCAARSDMGSDAIDRYILSIRQEPLPSNPTIAR